MKLTPVSSYQPKPGEKPIFSIRKKFLFGETCYVVATWLDGTASKVKRFNDRKSAAYWMEVEAELWLEHFHQRAAA